MNFFLWKNKRCFFVFLGNTKYISQKRRKIMTFSEHSHSLYLVITPIFLDTSLISSSEQLEISLLQHKCKIFHPAKLKQCHLSLSETVYCEDGFCLAFWHLLISQFETCPFIIKRNIEENVLNFKTFYSWGNRASKLNHRDMEILNKNFYLRICLHLWENKISY